MMLSSSGIWPILAGIIAATLVDGAELPAWSMSVAYSAAGEFPQFASFSGSHLERRLYLGVEQVQLCPSGGVIPIQGVCCDGGGWCPGGTTCNGTACSGTCPSICSNVCTNVAYAPGDCGQCGNACPSTTNGGGARICTNGACSISCFNGYTLTGSTNCVAASANSSTSSSSSSSRTSSSTGSPTTSSSSSSSSSSTTSSTTSRSSTTSTSSRTSTQAALSGPSATGTASTGANMGNADDKNGGGGLALGAIIGIAAAGVVALAVIIGGAIYLTRKKPAPPAPPSSVTVPLAPNSGSWSVSAPSTVSGQQQFPQQGVYYASGLQPPQNLQPQMSGPSTASDWNWAKTSQGGAPPSQTSAGSTLIGAAAVGAAGAYGAQDQQAHWFFSSLAAQQGKMGDDSIQYIGPPLPVVAAHDPTAEDEIALSPGNFVNLASVFKDGWAIGTNINSQTYGVFPVDCLRLPSASQSVGSASQRIASRNVAVTSQILSQRQYAGGAPQGPAFPYPNQSQYGFVRGPPPS
ncbi:hypothetical protein M427DRAFT_52805 [Gonapodya prolifera JEL478]|uniref:SH3 domain-containing protein n=1 Tax=Gonapodya prolifera (strain JEL478) TaxID=1344416 RepID=A0A139ASB7_GONPJ|nr:hypothetical protein M427DRAFT_52805 [Gonapodya prolifera JEL478]|eukprot:KXS19365.1 hypothetical protein M427DRAFT_52805 [Gonapodya prolifera JEL478]